MKEELLQIKKDMKERKPDFIRQDYGRRKRINFKWRKPKGIHSKIRHKFKGRRKMPSPGYRSPLSVRWLHASGLKIVNVGSVNEIQNIKKESDGIIIQKSVGLKKRFDLLKKAKQLGISVLNLNIDQEIKKIEDFVASKKKKEPKQEKHKHEEKAKEPKAPKKEQKLTEEEKKEYEEKEKQKVLTKKT